MEKGNMIRFRLAFASDLPVIADLYDRLIEAIPEGATYVSWRKRIYPTRITAENALTQNQLYVLENGNEIVGTVILNHVQDAHFALANWHFHEESATQVMVVHTLAIDPKHKKQGYGRMIMEKSRELAYLKGVKALRLDTRFDNTPARSLYESFGFQLCRQVTLEKNREQIAVMLYELVLP